MALSLQVPSRFLMFRRSSGSHKSCSSDRSWSVSYGALKLRGAALKMISRTMVE